MYVHIDICSRGGEGLYLRDARTPSPTASADLGRVMNNACDKFASHACKRAGVIPLAVPFYRPIPWIQLSNSFHAAKYHSIISYDRPTPRQVTGCAVRDPDTSRAR